MTINKINKMTGTNQNDVSTPRYANERMKKIDTNKVMRSRYFIFSSDSFICETTYKTFHFSNFFNRSIIYRLKTLKRGLLDIWLKFYRLKV
ncbi:MAG: hypothetical protein DRM98_04265 [Thermoplasmata archaeon]|nr:MAG: hypothetical protein DRM98_04265 [Thermoplasmata archaeon]RLF51432.1 MAG: hypothetical protein DRN24_05005 [Thermoplasmata archaeon]